MSVEVRVHDNSVTEDPAFPIAGDKVFKALYVDSSTYWKDQRYEYDAGNLIYKGLNVTHKAGTDAATWYIWKYTYDVNDDITRAEGPLVGAWDDRAALAWAA